MRLLTIIGLGLSLLFTGSCCSCPDKIIDHPLLVKSTADACEAVEVVTSIPSETSIQDAGTRRAYEVWVEMIKRAESSVCFEEFYLTGKEGSALEPVVREILNAAGRGVKVRILTSSSMASNSETLISRFSRSANIEILLFDWKDLINGGLHAKFFVVDGKEAFVGSQNFDWRALEHIHETGLRIGCPKVVAALQAIFDADWAYHTGQSAAYERLKERTPIRFDQDVFLVSSPAELNPPGVRSAIDTLVRLIDGAQKKITVQLLSYHTDIRRSDERYYRIDTALRRAAARGVEVKMLISDWNKRKPRVDDVKELAMQQGIEVKFVTIPEHSSGFIPYSRVIHSKVMRVDDHLSWVGTSNWARSYFHTSRNVEVVLRLPHVAATLDQLFESLWKSEYAYLVDPQKEYQPPKTH
jgi:phosphatidylserine/phosphatidylglycerophosphate/cardiolipin synthase-like enzyme